MTDYANWSARARAPETRDEPTLRAAIREGPPHRRREAVLALVDEASDGSLADETVACLADVLVTEDDPDVRQFAVEALGHVDDEADASLRTALDDSDEWVRTEAVVALSRQDAPTEVLARALDDESGWVRRNALIALGKRDALDQSQLERRLAEDAHESVREYAASFLDEGDDVESAVDALGRALRRDPNAFVRTKAAASLGALGTDDAIALLESVGASDPSDDVRRTAKQAVSRARGHPVENDDSIADYGGPARRPEDQRL